MNELLFCAISLLLLGCKYANMDIFFSMSNKADQHSYFQHFHLQTFYTCLFISLCHFIYIRTYFILAHQ